MFFFIIIYIVILFVPFIINKKGSLFYPDKMYCLLNAYVTIPFLLLSHFDENLITETLVFLKANLGESILRFMTLQSLGTIVFYWSYYTKKHISKKFLFLPKKYIFHQPISRRKTYVLYLIFTLASIILFSQFLNSKGGFEQILFAFANRMELVEGEHGNLYLLSFFTMLSSIYLIKSWSLSKNRFFVLFVIINYIYFFLAMSISGSRSPFILLLLQTLIAYNFYYKKVNLFSIKFIPIYILIIVYIIFIPLFRKAEFLDSNINMDAILADNMGIAFSGNGYVNIQLYILDHFNWDNMWYGKSYVDLFYSWIPRSIFIDKPPIDEGIYIANLYLGDSFQPTTPAHSMVFYSWPPGTMGIGYINFHIIGIVLAYFILGRIQKIIQLIFIEMNYAPFILFLYTFIVIKFQLTNFYIFSAINYILLLIVFSFFCKLTVRNK